MCNARQECSEGEDELNCGVYRLLLCVEITVVCTNYYCVYKLLWDVEITTVYSNYCGVDKSHGSVMDGTTARRSFLIFPVYSEYVHVCLAKKALMRVKRISMKMLTEFYNK